MYTRDETREEERAVGDELSRLIAIERTPSNLTVLASLCFKLKRDDFFKNAREEENLACFEESNIVEIPLTGME